MHLTKYLLIALAALCGSVACGKLKLLALKGPHGGFVGLKYRKPKLLGHGLGGIGGGFGGAGGFGGFGGGGYEHHEHHESHHSYSSGGGFAGGGAFGGKLGWLGK